MEVVKTSVFICSKCGKAFFDSIAAADHEAGCKEGTQYRVVMLRPKALNPELVSEIRHMPDADARCTETGSVFHWTADSYEIYTFDLSEKEELRCKQLVLEEAIKAEKEAIIEHKAVLKPCQRMLDEVYAKEKELEDAER